MRLKTSLLGDIALAAAIAAIGVAITSFLPGVPGENRPVDMIAIALVLLNAAVLVVRQQWPLVTLAVTAVLTSTYLVASYPYGPVFAPFFVAVYTIARREPLNRAAVAAGAALPLLLTHLLTNEAALSGFLGLIPATAWVVVPFAIGVTVRISRQAVARERAEAVRQRVYDERMRVAQEVHDVVGHGLAAIKMQADIALHLLAKKPDQAETALTAISRTSTEALDELRATLAAVRWAESWAGSDGTRAPVTGLDRLEDLRRRMSAAGLRVDVETTGSPRDLPAAVDLAGYRVVQESLTNVLRHGDGMVATVRVGYETDAVVIAISNPAAHVSTRESGLGIPGMRERVTSLGGDFTAGPTPDGRFEVHASIPTNGHP